MEIAYWIILFIWIGVTWVLKKDSGFSLMLAFILFLIAAVLTVFGLRMIAEPIMRVSFIGWIIGLVQALAEYKKLPKEINP